MFWDWGLRGLVETVPASRDSRLTPRQTWPTKQRQSGWDPAVWLWNWDVGSRVWGLGSRVDGLGSRAGSLNLRSLGSTRFYSSLTGSRV
eukprot:714371-Rhodomonas_salina.1